MYKLQDVKLLTFDVVGTLIDFERGITDWFRPTLRKLRVEQDENSILTAFAHHEHLHQQRSPEKPFTAMLPLIYRDMMRAWQLPSTAREADDFRLSIRNWPAFDDTIKALAELKKHFKMLAVTNVDAWALEHLSATMNHPFDGSVTCDEVGVNKPNHKVFDWTLRKLAAQGFSHGDILHTAQSQYHDIIPATELGIATMWIERRHGKDSFGATPQPQRLAEPDFHATSMADFVRQLRS